MTRAVLYYVWKGRLKDKTFWALMASGLAAFGAFVVTWAPFRRDGLVLFANGIGPLFLVYYSVAAGVNGLGKDRGRGYLEILTTRPLTVTGLAAGYWAASISIAAVFYAVAYPLTLGLLGRGPGLSPELTVVLPLTTILLFSSYSVLLSLVSRENSYLVLTLLLIILSFTIPAFAPKLKPMMRLLWPASAPGKILACAALLGLSWAISKRSGFRPAGD